ncbi:hypothetical protein [Microbispora triticiradicis]|uniref:WYL domain-containing protein n=2 Tax=Microbispora TaxID=2005 RepID=A0ABY3LYX6_9ACTN|nr:MULTISPECIES: hypothetical protein [Microbispora]TLP56311.1 hypothetical protein FED44_23625 [Microbispora fusca]TYB59037.1 hypothetical protein FXF59_15740 [Microbispora tritici]
MPDKPLSQRETAILLLLMAEAREVTNPELKEQYGVEIEKQEREHLLELRLIDVGKKGQAYTYTLSDGGWLMAAKIFREGLPKSGRPAGRVLEASLRAMVTGVQRHMQQTDFRLAEIFGREPGLIPTITKVPVEEPSVAEVVAEPTAIVETPPASVVAQSWDDIETTIRKAYAQLADKPNAWVSLTLLRPHLGDAPRDKVDDALRRMITQPDVHIVPWESQKNLSQEDRDAAVIIGDQPKHRILIGA